MFSTIFRVTFLSKKKHCDSCNCQIWNCKILKEVLSPRILIQTASSLWIICGTLVTKKKVALPKYCLGNYEYIFFYCRWVKNILTQKLFLIFMFYLHFLGKEKKMANGKGLASILALFDNLFNNLIKFLSVNASY